MTIPAGTDLTCGNPVEEIFPQSARTAMANFLTQMFGISLIEVSETLNPEERRALVHAALSLQWTRNDGGGN